MSAFSFLKYVRGYVYVHLTGYGAERFLNLCSNHDILIWNLKPVADGYEFCISTDGFRQLKPLLKKTKTKVRIRKKQGLPFLLFRYRKHKIFAAGILFFLFLLLYASGFIWNIEITGNSYLSDDTLLTFLQKEHAGFGSRIRALDCEQLEEKLRTEFPDVIWTSVRIYGTKMNVEIQENLLSDEADEVPSAEISDIIAKKDGEIVSIITRTGTPLVTEHATVKKGDILVLGSVAVTNDDGEVVRYLYPGADADITAQTTYTYIDELSVTLEKREKTGKRKTNPGLRILGYTFCNPFFENPYEYYSRTEEQFQLHFTDNFYLPVFLVREHYEEYTVSRVTRSMEEAKRLAGVRFAQYLLNLEEKGIQITEKDVMIEKLNQKYVVKGTVTVYESIVSYEPAQIFEITSEERPIENESD